MIQHGVGSDKYGLDTGLWISKCDVSINQELMTSSGKQVNPRFRNRALLFCLMIIKEVVCRRMIYMCQHSASGDKYGLDIRSHPYIM